MTPGTWTRVLCTGALLALAAPAAAGIKCWTNDEGVRECGNVVPPKYIRKGHEEITHSGASVTRHEGALSPEEVAARERARAEAERRQELVRVQRREDMILLRTYTTERELELAVKEKLAVIDSSVRLARDRLEKLRATLEQLRARAARQEKGSAQGVSDKTRESIAQVETQIAEHERYIAEQQQEREDLRARYEKDLERFRRLKSGAIEPGDISHLEDPDGELPGAEPAPAGDDD